MTTVWDRIYQDYVRGQVHDALTSNDILPDFKSFVETSAFTVKDALDIGCGRGRYLKYLEELGFTVSGIDSSPTAIALSKSLLNTQANVVLADMFEYDIPKNKFDLIVSISTIHHGKKTKVNSLLNRIISAIRPNGKIFIVMPVYPDGGPFYMVYKKINSHIMPFSLPNREISDTLRAPVDKVGWEKENDWIYIGDGETLSISGPEKGIIHSFYKKQELDKLFSNCPEHTIEKKGKEWIIKATRGGAD